MKKSLYEKASFEERIIGLPTHWFGIPSGPTGVWQLVYLSAAF